MPLPLEVTLVPTAARNRWHGPGQAAGIVIEDDYDGELRHNQQPARHRSWIQTLTDAIRVCVSFVGGKVSLRL
jgi:hypothetical protein